MCIIMSVSNTLHGDFRFVQGGQFADDNKDKTEVAENAVANFNQFLLDHNMK